jgi:hypothetical protein
MHDNDVRDGQNGGHLGKALFFFCTGLFFSISWQGLVPLHLLAFGAAVCLLKSCQSAAAMAATTAVASHTTRVYIF